MKRLLIIMSVLVGMMFAGMSAIAHDNAEQLPEHPHLLVQRPVIGFVEIGGESVLAVVDIRKCVDLANNRALPLRSQHHNVHQGTAGLMLTDKAGHAVVPAAPFPGIPWANCEEFEAMLPIPLPSGE